MNEYSVSKIKRIKLRIKEVINNEGINRLIFLSGRKVYSTIFGYKFRLIMNRNKKFKFDNKNLKYYYNKKSWNNERIIEIPIIMQYVKNIKNKSKILEIGNVLSNYFNIQHDVLDKYDSSNKKIINEDIVTYKTNKEYDLIISISTLEHVGWDEKPKKPENVIKAYKNLQKILPKNKMLVITIPINYNTFLDKAIKEEKIKFTKIFYLKRINYNNEWIQTTKKDFFKLKYNSPYPSANGLIVGVYKK